MENRNKIFFHPAYTAGRIDRRLFGAFLEPIGNWVYGGIWNNEHPTADEYGFRKDIMDMTRELGVPAVRLPGGNFTSGWNWKDSIGPRENRRTHLELAWRQYETNDIGHDEYLAWAKSVGTDPLYTVNLGTGTVEDAQYLAEYTRHPGGTYWSDLRRKNGFEKPHEVHTWCLGNEMDGPWQIHSWEKDPKGYGVKSNEISKMIKWVDPTAETVVCGTSTPHNRSYLSWDLTVLEQCYETVDYLSLHYYHPALTGDLKAYLSASDVCEDFLIREIAACDVMQGMLREPHPLMIAFDEYGVSFRKQEKTTVGRAGNIDHSAYSEFGSRLKQPFKHNSLHPSQTRNDGVESEMLESLALCSILMMLMRHADRVKIGCMTPGLFVIGHNEEKVWKRVGYYAYEMLIRYGSRGFSLTPSISCGTYDTDGYNIDDFSQVPAQEGLKYLESSASLDPASRELSVFVINRSCDQDLETQLDLTSFGDLSLIEHKSVYTDDLSVCNTAENPECVVPKKIENTKLSSGVATAVFKKLSFNMLRFRLN